MLRPVSSQHTSVILSGATASQSEAVAESKDPYPLNITDFLSPYSHPGNLVDTIRVAHTWPLLFT